MRISQRMTWGMVAVLLMAMWAGVQAQDSLGMQRVATLEYWPSANDIQMVGDLAYVMGGLSGLHIMDLADPAHPVEVGHYTWHPGDVTGGVYVTGNRAYLCLVNRGIVLDVSDPAHLAVLGEWDATTSSGISDITLVHGDIAIAQSDESYPYVLDVSDPTDVHRIGSFTDISGPMDALGMAGEYLCMMGWPGGVIVYDISDPTEPQRVAACDTAWRARYGTVSGNYAYLATGNGLRIVDLTDPLQPVPVAACDTLCWDVTIAGTHAVVSSIGMNIWDIAGPAHPVFEGALPRPADSHGLGKVSASGNTICIQNYGPRVAMVVNISNPAAPVVTSEFGNYGLLERMVISGTIGYLADARYGLRTIDLADPAHAYELANLGGSSCGALNVAVRGDYAYLAEGHQCGLFVVDVSDPAQPESLHSVLPPQLRNALRVLTWGDYAYVFDTGSLGGGSYLHTFSLANPELPEWVDSLRIVHLIGSETFDVTVANGYLYFVQEWDNFSIFSLANPAAPQLVGTCGLPHLLESWARSVAVAGDYAYVADGGGGLVIVNIANPTAPYMATTIEGYCWRVAASQNILFADDRFSRIAVMDITDPTQPAMVGYYSTSESMVDMKVAGLYLYTTSPSEFRVYRVDALSGTTTPDEAAPQEFALYPCYPNPFNPSTVIRFSLPRTEHATLVVYDTMGRQVRVLVDGVLTAGIHSVMFEGAKLPSGVYFVRLEGGTAIQTEKMILLK